MTKKLISIIINCFNGEKYLKKNLNSILKQKYQKYEVIFVDNCSTDSSSKIYKQVGAKLAGPGEVRDGGSFLDRMGSVVCWNSVMDENQYMVRKWNEFIAA